MLFGRHNDGDLIWVRRGTIEVLRHKQELRTRAVPANVRQSVKNQYRGYRIAEAEKLREGNEVVYKLELKNWTRDFDVFVSEGGEILEGFIWD